MVGGHAINLRVERSPNLSLLAPDDMATLVEIYAFDHQFKAVGNRGLGFDV
jgi:ABC-type uncharacterized transport system permease subunit